MLALQLCRLLLSLLWLVWAAQISACSVAAQDKACHTAAPASIAIWRLLFGLAALLCLFQLAASKLQPLLLLNTCSLLCWFCFQQLFGFGF
jgi:hypothetical protein